MVRIDSLSIESGTGKGQQKFGLSFIVFLPDGKELQSVSLEFSFSDGDFILFLVSVRVSESV